MCGLFGVTGSHAEVGTNIDLRMVDTAGQIANRLPIRVWLVIGLCGFAPAARRITNPLQVANLPHTVAWWLMPLVRLWPALQRLSMLEGLTVAEPQPN